MPTIITISVNVKKVKTFAGLFTFYNSDVFCFFRAIYLKQKMKFSRVTVRRLPNGTIAHVCPYHVFHEGVADRVLCRDREDYDVMVKFICIMAIKCNVIVVTYTVVSNHSHVVILADSQQQADKYHFLLKLTYSRWFTHKYGEHNVMRKTRSKAQLLDSDWYTRNTISYVVLNIIDNGGELGNYAWSGFRAAFNKGYIEKDYRKVSDLGVREMRNIFHSKYDVRKQNWLLNNDNEIVPQSVCDSKYVEEAFLNDEAFFHKQIGITNIQEMEHGLIDSVKNRLNDSELYKEVSIITEKWYGKTPADLSLSQKIRITPYLYRKFYTSQKQLARVLSIKL